MITYAQLAHTPRLLQNFTGLSAAAFARLLTAFVTAYTAAGRSSDAQRTTPRQRQPGGGRHATLQTPADKLLFILLYFRFYPTQELVGFLFGISQPQANVWVHRLTPVLNAALGQEQQLPARKTRTVQELLAACPTLAFIIDGTERPIQRPTDPTRQREHYSGKKKRHTVKNILLSDKRTKKIKGLGRTRPGKIHDKRATEDEDYRFPPGSTLFKDTGFQGYEPPDIQTRQPKKKPRNGVLTDEERALNRTIACERIGVEHSIGGIKTYRIVHDVYRNHRPDDDDLVMETACGLHNLRCDMRQ